jgi:anti-anti-sigma factor
MEMQSSELESGILGITLTGRMDSAGAQQIDMRFTALTVTRKAPILVDMSGVTFLASIGIRTLISSARAQKNRGGVLVIYRPIPMVEEVLASTGVDAIIPIAHDMDGARKALNLA